MSALLSQAKKLLVEMQVKDETWRTVICSESNISDEIERNRDVDYLVIIKTYEL